MHDFGLLYADSKSKAVTGISELVNAMLHICLGGSDEGKIISKQEVVDGVRLNLGFRLQPFEVED